MRMMGLLAACVAVILAGFVIGTIPVVNENLHWNIWFIVPISGAILGAALGWVQFQIARASGVRVGRMVAVALALATSVGYLATEVGTYWTTTVQLEQDGDLQAGEYRLRDLTSFAGYMQARLESSSVELRPGRSQSRLDLGSWAATVSFGVDLLGAWLGSFMVLLGSARGAPYCDRCRQYKKRVGRSELPLEESTAVETLEQLQEQVEAGCYESVVSFLNGVAKREPPEKLTLKIAADERVCPGCNEATLLCRVLRLQGNEWKDVMELCAASTPGNTALLTAGP